MSDIYTFFKQSFIISTLLFGHRKIIRPIKNQWWGAGVVILSGVRCKWLAYGPSDATATPSSLLLKIQNGLSLWYQPTQVFLEKRLLKTVVVLVCFETVRPCTNVDKYEEFCSYSFLSVSSFCHSWTKTRLKWKELNLWRSQQMWMNELFMW